MSKRSIVAQSKQAERDVAERIDGRRLSSGEWGGAGDVDVISPTVIVQVKQRSGVPLYITEGLQQVRDAGAARAELLRLEPEIVQNPILTVALVTKPGRGRKSETLYILDEEQMDRLLVEASRL